MLGERVAGRYARALFEIAQKDQKVGPYGEVLGEISEAIEKNSDLKEFLITPHVPMLAKKEAVANIFGEAPVVVQNFLFLLIDKQRGDILPTIVHEYRKIADQESRILEVSVISAKKLNSAEELALQKKLEEVSGRNIRVINQEDASILGGLLIRIGNRWIDGSVRGQLRTLGDRLMNSAQKQMEVEG